MQGSIPLTLVYESHRISAPNLEPPHALQVLIKASSYNDKILADTVVRKAAEVPLAVLSADDWGSLTIPTIMSLVRRMFLSDFALTLTREMSQVKCQHGRVRELTSAMPCEIHVKNDWARPRRNTTMPCPLDALDRIFPNLFSYARDRNVGDGIVYENQAPEWGAPASEEI